MMNREFERAFVELYKPLGMYALRIVGDVDAAEDAVQEAFAAVWAKVREGVRIDALKPYMYRAVRNAALMRLRQAGSTVSIDELGELELAESAGAAVSDADVEMAERDAALWEAVDRLPQRCRQVFLLCKRDGMSYADVALEMEISVKTVENQMNKALKTLRAALGPERPSDRTLYCFLL